MTFSLRGIAWTAFAIAVALVVGCSVFLYRATHRLSASDGLVNHTREVQAALEDLNGEVFRASNSAQDFALTGDGELLDGYDLAVKIIPLDLDRLEQLTSDNPSRSLQWATLRADIQSELELIAGFIGSHKKGTASIDADAHMARLTATIQEHIEQELQQIQESEEQLLAERVREARGNYLHALGLIAILVGIALLLLALQTFLLDYSFSQYRKTESAARQSREIVDAFFASSTVGFGILDSNLQYTRVNDVLPRMVGMEPEDLIGKSVIEGFGLQGTQTDTVLQNVLRSGVPVLDREISTELRNKRGQVRHWLVNYFPIPGEKDKFTQIGIIAVDVTARRRAESTLRKLSGRLLGIQDQERRRIARELHDSLGQYLAGLKIAIELLGASPNDRRKELLNECGDILQKAITETRTLSHLLHPPLLDEAGFSSAASWFVSGFSQRSGIPVSLDLPSDMPRLPQTVEIALFRILQESLTNVHRHSQTSSAEIRVEADAEQITIEIVDYGRGMPPHVLDHLRGDGTKLGVGLAGMRERVRELGGEFDVTSGQQGTKVRAKIPLTGQETAPAVNAQAASTTEAL